MQSSLLHRSHSLRLLLAAGMFLLLTACGTPLPRVKPAPIETFPYKAEREGIVLALKPVVAKDELKRQFGNDLFSLGMLPIQVAVANHTASTSFIIEGKNFSLDGGAARATRDLLPSPGTALWLGGGGLIGGTLAANRENSRISMALAEFRSYTVSPGRVVQGFLFFQLPDKLDPKNADWRLRVKANDIDSDHEVELDVPFTINTR